MVDTGGTETTIKWDQVEGLGLAPRQTLQKISGVAGTIMNVYVTSSNFSVGELHIKHLPLYVEARNLAEADGTLAPDVMRDYDVDIDFARNSLSLISQNHCPGHIIDRTAAGSFDIPVNITGDGHVRFRVKIDGHEIMATLDTGSAVSFISKRATALLGIDPKAPELRLARDTGTYQLFTYPFQFFGIRPRIGAKSAHRDFQRQFHQRHGQRSYSRGKCLAPHASLHRLWRETPLYHGAASQLMCANNLGGLTQISRFLARMPRPLSLSSRGLITSQCTCPWGERDPRGWGRQA